MWTLAHAHGTLLAAINILFGLTLRIAAPAAMPRVRLASASLIAAGILLPLGFFLSGVAFYGGDPGLGVLLVPIGGVLLLVSIFWIARATSGSR